MEPSNASCIIVPLFTIIAIFLFTLKNKIPDKYNFIYNFFTYAFIICSYSLTERFATDLSVKHIYSILTILIPVIVITILTIATIIINISEK